MGLQWKDYVAVCTDGVVAMTGQRPGFQGRVKSADNAPITFRHCILHSKVFSR